jgi:ABC-type glycerol-3-phosphate transport system substrate-binding protein
MCDRCNLQSMCIFGVKRVGDVREDHSEHLRGAFLQRAGVDVRPILQDLDGSSYPRSRLGRHPPRAVVEETGLAPTPAGPSGKRASMYNGLADSIWVGAKNKPGAAKWVEFLGSPDCQNIVGEKAVVFPAIPEATEKAEAAWKAKGIDTTPFTIQVDEKTTFLFPITDYASQITGIMTPAMDEVMTGKSPPESLTEANNQVNQLFG